MQFGYSFRFAEAPRHPWIIISSPDSNGGWIVMVNLTDITNTRWAEECVVVPKDWPSVITKKSNVAFAGAQGPHGPEKKAGLLEAILNPKAEILSMPPDPLLRKITVAALGSDFLSPAQKKWVVRMPDAPTEVDAGPFTA